MNLDLTEELADTNKLIKVNEELITASQQQINALMKKKVMIERILGKHPEAENCVPSSLETLTEISQNLQ
jgi:hypothetical protein